MNGRPRIHNLSEHAEFFAPEKPKEVIHIHGPSPSNADDAEACRLAQAAELIELWQSGKLAEIADEANRCAGHCLGSAVDSLAVV
jgi:hypothetical protein